MTTSLKERVVQQFIAVNGKHQMTESDDAYVDGHFAPLETLAAEHDTSSDSIRAEILARRLPLPSYLRSDLTEMMPKNYFAVIELAGGVAQVRTWFCGQWAEPSEAESEWGDFLNGHYLCLRDPLPQNMRRKSELISEIERAAQQARQGTGQSLAQLHELVDELDAIEQPFTEYDRLRFAGPVSRDTAIDDIRRAFPRSQDH